MRFNSLDLKCRDRFCGKNKEEAAAMQRIGLLQGSFSFKDVLSEGEGSFLKEFQLLDQQALLVLHGVWFGCFLYS